MRLKAVLMVTPLLMIGSAVMAGTPGLTGVYHGQHLLTMRGCPGACQAGSELVLGKGIRNADWSWNFDEGWVLIRGTTLTVGFDYEVQSIGNRGQGDDRLTAGFADNLDGTYTVYHGFQIYNPNVGNPRADTSTTFEITEDPDNPNLIVITTVDNEPGGVPDGIPGTQIVGVFPMTVQPDFTGSARLEGSSSGGDGISDQLKEQLGLNPDADNADTDGDDLPDVDELGADPENPVDADADGVIDALEPGAAAQDPQLVAGVALLDGIPGRQVTGDALSGTTAEASVGEPWRFTSVATGYMSLATDPDGDSAIPDTTRGDAGLEYQYGFIRFDLQVSAVTSDPVTVRLTFQAPLPESSRLLLYAAQAIDGNERYQLMASDAYQRLEDHTLEIRLYDNGPWDLNPVAGVLTFGVAPVENTLGGHQESSGNGGGIGGAALALLALLAACRRRGAVP
ncbi:hypothetical protein ACRYJU_02810 [Alloalcanivorax xenomutans]|uniref:hypothetical protein n=1 Tax=Alloalcanivorax xenomutans TaxID=1094342 RepID=UPI003D9B580F